MEGFLGFRPVYTSIHHARVIRSIVVPLVFVHILLVAIPDTRSHKGSRMSRKKPASSDTGTSPESSPSASGDTMTNANLLAMQLIPEHRLFAQAFVATRGDRGASIIATGRPCPVRALKRRCAELLARNDIQRYIYALLQADPDARQELCADPEWRDTIDEIVRTGGAGGFSSPSPPPSPVSGTSSIPAGAAKNCPSVAASEPIPLGDLSAIQQMWLEMSFDPYQPSPIRLKASELYARSFGAFDPGNKKTTRTPITITIPKDED